MAEVELRSALGKATESGGKALVPKFPANSGQECERGRKSQEVEALIHHRTSRLITRSGSCENIQLNRNCQTWFVGIPRGGHLLDRRPGGEERTELME